MSLVKSQGNLRPAISCERIAQPKAGMDNWYLPGMLAHTCQPNPLEAEVGGLLEGQGYGMRPCLKDVPGLGNRAQLVGRLPSMLQVLGSTEHCII